MQHINHRWVGIVVDEQGRSRCATLGLKVKQVATIHLTWPASYHQEGGHFFSELETFPTLIAELAETLGVERERLAIGSEDLQLSIAEKEIAAASDQMRGGPAIQSAAFGLLRASARLAQAAVQRPDDLDELWHLEQQARRALSRLQTVLNRAEW